MNRLLSPSRYKLFLALIVLLAAGLRFYRIEAQSFWNDEGNSARLAERSVDLILEGAEGDIHPPGYYLALKYWRAILGQSEMALRGLSALCSVLLVFFTSLLGRRLFQDETVGLAAAALAALNPFQVYYAQEARMYAMLALWGGVSTWALVEWLLEGRRWPLAVYALTAAAGLYTHYAFPFVLLAHNLGVGINAWAGREKGTTVRRLLAWVGAQGAMVALYLPWLPTAWHQVTSWSSVREPYQFLSALADIARLLSFGPTISTEIVTVGLMAVGSCIFLSLLPPADADENPDESFSYNLRWGVLGLLVLIAVGLILGLGLYKPVYQKFLLVAAAPLSVLVGRGIISGWRIAGGIGAWGDQKAVTGYRAVMLLLLALITFDTVRSLNNLYFDETYTRADYRAIARHIQANARPGDAVLLNAPNQWEVFTYYYPDEHVFPLARQRPLNAAKNQAELEEIAAHYQCLYGIFWGDAESDPQRFIESWLETHTFKAGESWYGDVRLAVYAVPDQAFGEDDTLDVALDARFGDSIYLDGYSLLTDALAPGDIIQLALFWRAVEPVSQRYKVFVHLYDESGRLVTQTDREPGAALRPTDTWSTGEVVVDHYGVLLPLEIPPGSYALVVGLYDLVDPDSRLPVARGDVDVGDRLMLEEIIVTGGE